MLRQKLDLDTDELLAELSSPLRAEVALQRCHAFLFNPKFAAILGFDSLDATGSIGQAMFIKELVRRLRPEVLSPGDFAIEEGEVGHSVHFLSRGVVAVIAGKGGDSFRVAELSVGDCFGEISLLVRPTLASFVPLASHLFLSSPLLFPCLPSLTFRRLPSPLSLLSRFPRLNPDLAATLPYRCPAHGARRASSPSASVRHTSSPVKTSRRASLATQRPTSESRSWPCSELPKFRERVQRSRKSLPRTRLKRKQCYEQDQGPEALRAYYPHVQGLQSDRGHLKLAPSKVRS